ncbi:MAG TPA: M90 family metallopeptidase, partial [Burkholderiaceae bacterium]|nr:M90 family metallopeptidase [Burkholderiaceae bacterium]
MSFTHWLRDLFNRGKPIIPDLLWQSCATSLPFLKRLTPDELARLKALCETFLQRKSIIGAAGLEVSNEIAVLIAMQASLLVLNLTLDLYDDMPGVIVYPSEFIVPHSEMDEAGVVHEWREPLAGEAITAGGAVVLSWEDIERADTFGIGYNVVIHEFAHKIDMERGAANGCPPFLPAFHRSIDARHWQRAFSAAYQDFTRKADAWDRCAPRDANWCGDLPLDPYAADNPGEFFAVASEAFFLTPKPLAAAYPQIYRLLADYYRQETLDAPSTDLLSDTAT